MTERRDGQPQSYIMHHVWQRPVCVTPGCHTFIMRPNELSLCLACQLDRDVPQPSIRPRMGRPPKEGNDA